MAKRKTRRNALVPTGLLEGIEFQTGGNITGPLLKKVGEVYARNPGKGSFARCVAAVTGKVSSPGAVCAASKRRTAAGRRELAKSRKNAAKRRNPVDAAADRYKYFHGKDPDVITEVTKQVHEHSVLSGIGKLEKIKIQGVTLGGFKGALLAQNEKGTQLFIEGGDQGVDLAAFRIKSPHEWEVLGLCTDVWYHTTKTHLDPRDGGTAVYHHKFGREKPTIVYDVVNKQLYFAGGGYSLPDVGIDG